MTIFSKFERKNQLILIFLIGILISFNLDGSHSTQDTNNIAGYIAMEIKF